MRPCRQGRRRPRVDRAVARTLSWHDDGTLYEGGIRLRSAGAARDLCRRLAQGGDARGMSQTRRLAAILAADVAGYSRLMGADEEGTLERLKGLRRELFDPKIVEHHGRIVKTTGDGLLVEFASVVDAVRCAVAVQHGMTERNVAVPVDRRIEFRVGINLGDIIIDDGDI